MRSAGYSCSSGTFEELFTKVDSDNDGCASLQQQLPRNVLHPLALTVLCDAELPGASPYRSGSSRTRTSSELVSKAQQCGHRQSSKLSATALKVNTKSRCSRPRQRGTGRTLGGKSRLL